MRKDGRPLVTEYPVTAEDMIPYLTREEFEELTKDENVIACSFGPTLEERTAWSKAQESASIRAAKLMASLYEALEGSGYDDHEASVFLVRTLFALYADDAGVWDRDMFLEFLETRTAEDGSERSRRELP